ncbi:21242_t:CDS:2 [Gigaspora margarita]|uniref:21242_t:CDS:1 n=1 Tax=Gigaspora margarita TaxID=4874 RepID=A0ABN7VIS8_GIGMA|nr:21242_t:CDS:2 [Gigaspora margarita]
MDHQILSQFLDTILYICETAFHDTCELSFAIPPRQHYELDKIPEHEYNNYNNDLVSGPSNSNQELYIYNINNESDDNMRSDESSESVQSDESDQKNENEINEIDNTCPNNSEKDIEDVIIEKPYYSASIYPKVCYLCSNLDVNQPMLLDTTRLLHFKKNLLEFESYAGSNNPTKHKGQRSFVKSKKVKSLHK